MQRLLALCLLHLRLGKSPGTVLPHCFRCPARGVLVSSGLHQPLCRLLGILAFVCCAQPGIKALHLPAHLPLHLGLALLLAALGRKAGIFLTALAGCLGFARFYFFMCIFSFLHLLRRLPVYGSGRPCFRGRGGFGCALLGAKHFVFVFHITPILDFYAVPALYIKALSGV